MEGNLSYDSLKHLRSTHPAWRLLASPSAPLVVSFLYTTFVKPNLRLYSQSELSTRLEDSLYHLRQIQGEDAFPRSGLDYLNSWAENDNAWLRKFYPSDNDEPHFDLTPATEKAIVWLRSLIKRPFVGTESRLLTVFNLLREIVEGTEASPEVRIAEKRAQIKALEDEIAMLQEGHVPLLDDAAVRDRFAQMSAMARELLSDFREVQENFRSLDRACREKIAQWDGTRGELLDDILGERDAISDSDQGRSFQAFWEFLMSSLRQEELTELLDKALDLPAVKTTGPDRRLRHIHYDWLTAGEETQRTVSVLSSQLRRFLDDKAWLENRRITEILRRVERGAIGLKDNPPKSANFMTIESVAADISLPLERPLFSPPLEVNFESEQLEVAVNEGDVSVLFELDEIDRKLLTDRVLLALGGVPQVSLRKLLEEHPLDKGLAELVAYLTLRNSGFSVEFHSDREEVIRWESEEGKLKQARLPRVVFVR